MNKKLIAMVFTAVSMISGSALAGGPWTISFTCLQAPVRGDVDFERSRFYVDLMGDDAILYSSANNFVEGLSGIQGFQLSRSLLYFSEIDTEAQVRREFEFIRSEDGDFRLVFGWKLRSSIQPLDGGSASVSIGMCFENN